jgi:hypothetical protein
VTDGTDPYVDPFDEDIHDPVVFALNGTDLLHERAQTVRQKFEAQLAVVDPAKNVLAVAARRAIAAPLAKLAELAVTAKMKAGLLRAAPEDQQADAFDEWTKAYSGAQRTLAEVEHLG